MARSGSAQTNHIAATSRVWYWELVWSADYNGNKATVYWKIYARCENGTSGSTYVENYGLSGNVHESNLSYSNRFYKDSEIASGSFELSGGSSFNVNIIAHPYSGSHTSSGSWTFTLDTAVTTPTVTCSVSKGLDSVTTSMSVTNYGGAGIIDTYIDLFTDSGCNNKVGSINGTSGTFTGLSPNTTYYVRANASNGYYRGYSDVIAVTTYDIAKITSVSDMIHGDNLSVQFSNPSGSNIEIGIYKTDAATALAEYRKVSGTSYNFNFSDLELDKIYRQYGSNNSFKIRVYIRTAGKYLSYAEITITLKGNQKTIHVNINNVYKRGKIYKNIDNKWHKGVIWKNIKGTWVRCA